MRDIVHGVFNFPVLHGDDEDSMNEHVGDSAEELLYLFEEPSRKAHSFHYQLEDGKQKLYSGCSRFSNLSVRLYHIKCMY
ncbi:hypothetical protein Ahy_B02g061633 [Arachis hypogaea]|uniref:Uncharacterized protein n=1 Tax=Arachis hypogaea TaxID=3818 RepID=A0A445ALQ2_ARAHY|nr:hypothetical protein Ahy_B02g061633 [Arachis hypogaea]